MAYNEELAELLHNALAHRDDVKEKKMFGGMAYMVDDKMCVGVVNNDLMVRINPQHNDEFLKDNEARPMDFTNRPMKGFIYVDEDGWRQPDVLDKWVQRALDFNPLAKASKKK